MAGRDARIATAALRVRRRARRSVRHRGSPGGRETDVARGGGRPARAPPRAARRRSACAAATSTARPRASCSLQWLTRPAVCSPGHEPPFSQLDAAGRLRHLITLDGLAARAARGSRSCALRCARRRTPRPRARALRGFTVANLFFEPCTRTRVSFELAAQRLGADVVNLDMHALLARQGRDAPRHDLHAARDAGRHLRHARRRAGRAGAGRRSSGRRTSAWSQRRRGARLASDAGTARRADDPPGTRATSASSAVAIVGDVAHSRVARSAHQALTTLGVADIRIVAPRATDAGRRRIRRQPPLPDARRGHRGRRRRDDAAHPARAHGRRAGGPIEAYHREFGLTAERLAARGAGRDRDASRAR